MAEKDLNLTSAQRYCHSPRRPAILFAAPPHARRYVLHPDAKKTSHSQNIGEFACRVTSFTFPLPLDFP
ncbi:hypothetical protein E2C01_102144 [Portunus trituberculatus]|uniref:Uncharacterized protein n=1 Tax=Portunus trituberculatus TaxID=210409 RepID=A0A5B7KLW7_PORTR|nr:hypothetical protein [Portunus trituberculatus]